ncbi:MAG: dihydrofolate reductase family protein [Planctomycetota bacterium]
MTHHGSKVTLHMVASLDGYIAREDGSTDWMATHDEYLPGASMDSEFIDAFLATIDCYVMGSRTYEVALDFEAKGAGWAYGDKPVHVLSTRRLPHRRESVQFHAGDLTEIVNSRLRPNHSSVWIVGGPTIIAECFRRRLADEVYYSVLPILIGSGIRFFGELTGDVALHLADVKAYRSGMVEMRYEIPIVADTY